MNSADQSQLFTVVAKLGFCSHSNFPGKRTWVPDFWLCIDDLFFDVQTLTPSEIILVLFSPQHPLSIQYLMRQMQTRVLSRGTSSGCRVVKQLVSFDATVKSWMHVTHVTCAMIQRPAYLGLGMLGFPVVPFYPFLVGRVPVLK